jgi:hypothetical protein
VSEKLATSVGSTHPRSITFEVSDLFLSDDSHWAVPQGDGWSPPCRFRFEKHDYDEGWDLVMKREDPA